MAAYQVQSTSRLKMLNLFCICLLVMLTPTQAQVYYEDRYIELLSGQKMNITNIEYPNGYPLGSARQTKIRAPHFCRIQLTCQVAVGASPGDCTDFNGILLQLDGTTYMNSSSVYQICDRQQVYKLTSRYNTAMIGHYSTHDANSKTGAWFCLVEAVRNPTCDCGWKRTTKIVGGTYSLPNAHPSMVALLDKYNNLRGAGTIIGDKAILTAAHTISDGNGGFQDINEFFASVGRLNVCVPFYEDTLYSENLKIVSYTVLPGFDESRDRNDMAILYTDQFLPESSGCGPICLPNPEKDASDYDYERATIVGFGSIGFGMRFSCGMKEGNVLLRPRERCKPHDVDTKICAQSIGKNATDTCQGDSGGPLYYFDPNIGRDRLIGVTQSGVYCGDVGFYESVAPRVNSFVMPNLHSACRFN